MPILLGLLVLGVVAIAMTGTSNAEAKTPAKTGPIPDQLLAGHRYMVTVANLPPNMPTPTVTGMQTEIDKFQPGTLHVVSIAKNGPAMIMVLDCLKTITISESAPGLKNTTIVDLTAHPEYRP